MPIRVSFPLKYACAFAGISALAAFLFTSFVFVDDSWRGLWMYVGFASGIVAYVMSRLLLSREDCSTSRKVIVGTCVALLSHWLCWYGFLLVAYLQGGVLEPGVPVDVVNPLSALFVAGGYALFSLAFLGWVSLPISILLCTWLKRAKPMDWRGVDKGA